MFHLLLIGRLEIVQSIVSEVDCMNTILRKNLKLDSNL